MSSTKLKRFAAAKGSERREVTVRKRYIELFHSRPVFKQTGGDALLDVAGDVSIKGGEEAETISLVAGAKNDLIKLHQNFIDGLWGHITVAERGHPVRLSA